MHLGTTFGGGPLACALINTVIDVLEEPGFLEKVQRTGEQIRKSCVVGPVLSVQGAGLLLGLRTGVGVSDLLPLLLEQGILAGGARDPNILRLLPPLTIGAREVDELRVALEALPC